jgi:hypothetical protein
MPKKVFGLNQVDLVSPTEFLQIHYKFRAIQNVNS